MSLPILVGIVAIPFAVKGLGKEAFGIFMIAWVIISYLTLLDFGLSRATTKFTSENLRTEDGRAVSPIMWTALFLGFCFGCLGAVLLYLLTPWLVNSLLNIPLNYIDETRKTLHLIGIALPFLMISISLKGMLGAAQRFDLVNVVHIPVNTLSFIFPALSVPFGFSLSQIMLFIVLSRIIASFLYFFLCLRIFPVCRQRPRWDVSHLKKLLSYGGWITVTGVISPILVYVDRFFIGSMLSMESLTYYSAPLEAITRLRILPMAIMTTVFPEFSAGLHVKNSDHIRMLFGKSLKVICLTTGLLSLILVFYGRDILHLWLGADFAERSATIFRIFSVSIFVNFLALVPFTYLQGIGRPDLPAKFHMIEFPLYIFGLWFLTGRYGIVGAAFAWFLRVALDFFLLYAASTKFLPGMLEAFRQNRVGRVLLLLLGGGILLIPVNVFLHDQILRFVFLAVLMLISLWIVHNYILDHTEKESVRSVINLSCFRSQ
jgi:O-antigen/teichoic acid export membrane protein